MAEPRSIFEEVSDPSKSTREVRETGIIERGSGGARKGIRAWLVVLFALIAVMVVVGGLTRLTDSGLSITEWNLVMGTIPPLNAEAWAAEFAKYQDSPQFRLMNSNMQLADFQAIYWWEWSHRQLGRVIGLVWIVGFLGFLAARRIPRGWTGRLVTIGALIGVQGAVGWWMVASGLEGEMTSVASYRLAVHLGLAFAILGLITWSILELGLRESDLMQARRQREGRLFSISTGLMHFAMLQILLGALVAGIDAGRSFTDWPLMAGQFFPPDAFGITPAWRNLFENAGLVQFLHRMSGYLLMIFAVVVILRARRSPNRITRQAFWLAFAMIVVQMLLGITTVLQAAHLHIAITHQIGALITWVLILNARFNAGYPRVQSVRG